MANTTKPSELNPSSHDPAPHQSHIARRARHTLLLQTTTSFCQSLLSPPSPKELLAKYFIPTHPKITEHGPEWSRSRLPFLGKPFIGSASCIQYFSILSEVLEMKLPADAFPAEEAEWSVDINASISGQSSSASPTSPIKTTFDFDLKGGGEGKGAVTVVGKGVFVARKTSKEWSESFIYRFSGFDDQGRIGHWEIWADPLSAWVAVGGGGEDLGLPVG